jgi:hypothetical protein
MTKSSGTNPERQPEDRPEDLLRDLAAELSRTLRRLEDLEDAFDADRAWEERGKSIPLEDLESEFGHK